MKNTKEKSTIWIYPKAKGNAVGGDDKNSTETQLVIQIKNTTISGLDENLNKTRYILLYYLSKIIHHCYYYTAM